MGFCSPTRWVEMSPVLLFDRRVNVDNGLFSVLTMEDFNFWSKLDEKHGEKFWEGFEVVDPGLLYPVCRHHFSEVHPQDYYYERYKGYAFYRDFYPIGCARILWWLESGLDIFYPESRAAYLFVEKLLYPAQDLLESDEWGSDPSAWCF